MAGSQVVHAAGCVVWRYGTSEPEVLLVHRPAYDDWSYAKGKLDRGESLPAAAVREVEEETGLRVRLGPRLPDQEYPVNGRKLKRVAYWAAPAPPRANITTYVANHEIDDVRWVETSAARSLMTYQRDVDLLDMFLGAPYDTTPLLILRHTKARPRKTWRGDDTDRPLLAEGRRQAERLVPLLDAFGVTRIMSSDEARCVDTVLPYVNTHDARLTIGPELSQHAATEKSARAAVREALDSDKRVALCSHRPVLPWMFEAMGIKPVALPAGGVVVAHRRGRTVLSHEVLC
ncbi:MAG: NUDIX hydrolase [Nocardioidaceae bacterium]